MSGRYTLEQREIISKIKTILGDFLNIPIEQALLISVDTPFDEMMSSVVAMDFIQHLREELEIELCWGRISENPTIDGILEILLDEKEEGYKCNSGN
jgi:hypothetical protein